MHGRTRAVEAARVDLTVLQKWDEAAAGGGRVFGGVQPALPVLVARVRVGVASEDVDETQAGIGTAQPRRGRSLPRPSPRKPKVLFANA